ncbi:hypothetical protein ACQP2F_00925 [Actinoplanes sp. CA-030573]|uniref:hypothetical protein n=1 Tax=Actinoplanes sp. CA-030573 TaxID=3239898 RepID=UPI003D92CDB5
MTSSRTSRRSAYLAPLMAMLALLGGVTFFGVLAVSGKSQRDILSNTAAVADSPKPARAKKAAVTSRVPTPPSPVLDEADSISHEPPVPSPASSADRDRAMSALPRKPVAPVERDVKANEECAPTGSEGRTENGKLMICEPTPNSDDNTWQPA